MPFDDDIKDVFDSEDLGNESWLEPSGDLFDKIAAEVYSEEKPPNKNFLLIMLISAILIFIFVGFIYLWKTSHSNNLTANFANRNFEEIERIQTSGSKAELTTDLDESTKNDSRIAEIDQDKEVGFTKSDDVLRKKQSINNLIKSPENGFDKSLALRSEIIKPNTYINNTLESPISEKEADINNIQFDGKRAMITSINYLKSINPSSLSQKNHHSINTAVPTIKKVVPKKWEIAFSSGINMRGFLLNKAYEDALNPADFSYNSSVGLINSIAIKRSLNKRFSAGFGLSYERINFSSGHNSQVSYSLLEEGDDHTNSFDLVMASPIGFINSNIVLMRSGNSQVDQLTDVVVDLDNEHRVNQLNYDLSLSYEQAINPILQMGFSAGIGMSQIVKVYNNLEHFEATNTAFIAQSSTILSNQQDIRKIRANYSVGFELNHKITKYQTIGLRYGFTQDLSPVFTLDAFETTLVGNRIALQYQYQF